MKSILRGLPKTADGHPIVLGDKLWEASPFQSDDPRRVVVIGTKRGPFIMKKNGIVASFDVHLENFRETYWCDATDVYWSKCNARKANEFAN